MASVLVVFSTRAGETEKIANLIGEGIRISGEEAKVVNANDIKAETDLQGYDAYVFGSATYHGEMMQKMKTVLFLAEKADLKDHVGGAFGAFGWSGEAPDRIHDTMKNVFGMKMVDGPLRLKSSSLEGGIQAAQNFGRDIVKAIAG